MICPAGVAVAPATLTMFVVAFSPVRACVQLRVLFGAEKVATEVPVCVRPPSVSVWELLVLVWSLLR